jgi:hypothetical protein
MAVLVGLSQQQRAAVVALGAFTALYGRDEPYPRRAGC